jgi:hypothetical protein
MLQSVAETRTKIKEPNSLMLIAFAFAVLCAYFARFAVPVLFDRKEREADAKKRKERTFSLASAESRVSRQRPNRKVSVCVTTNFFLTSNLRCNYILTTHERSC